MRSNRLSQSPRVSTRAARSTGPPIIPGGPASGQRSLFVDALHDHQLLPAGRAGHDPHVATRDPELLARMRISDALAAPSTAGAITATLSTPSTTSSTRSTADRGVRRTAKRTLEKLKTSEGVPGQATEVWAWGCTSPSLPAKRESPADGSVAVVVVVAGTMVVAGSFAE